MNTIPKTPTAQELKRESERQRAELERFEGENPPPPPDRLRLRVLEDGTCTAELGGVDLLKAGNVQRLILDADPEGSTLWIKYTNIEVDAEVDNVETKHGEPAAMGQL